MLIRFYVNILHHANMWDSRTISAQLEKLTWTGVRVTKSHCTVAAAAATVNSRVLRDTALTLPTRACSCPGQ